jgi:hypothetical protein
MMEGIDSTFDAVVFIGYHAKAGTPGAILEHTSTGNVVDFSINGVSLPEMVLKVQQERPLHPGARKVRDGEVTFTSPDLLTVLAAFNAMK